MTVQTTVGRLLAREGRLVAWALVLAVALAAAFTLSGGGTGMSAMRMTAAAGPLGALLAGAPDVIRPVVWTPGYAAVIVAMWWLMMVAMMLPSAAPAVLLYGAISSARGARGPLEFLVGYLAIWAGFSALATLLQGTLAAYGLISPMYMTIALPGIGAIILVGVGLYQLTRTKAACLVRCRGPVETLIRYRQTGRAAAFRMGLRHGVACLGCCWALMVLLFVGGVMNIWWILGITLYVAAEKLAPWGHRLARPAGGVLILGGLALLATTIPPA